MQSFSLNISYNSFQSQKPQLRFTSPHNPLSKGNIYLISFLPESHQSIANITKLSPGVVGQTQQENIRKKFDCYLPFSDTPNSFLELNHLESSKISTTSTMTSPDKKNSSVSESDDTFDISSNLDSNLECEASLIGQESVNWEAGGSMSKMNDQSRKIKKEPSLTVLNRKKRGVPVKKGHWTAHEDSQILELLAQQGPKWSHIGSIIGARTGKQVRDRYLNVLKPDINHNEWTEEEDKLFKSLIKQMGKKWCQIAACLPGRTESQVKNRFYSQSKKYSFQGNTNSDRNIIKEQSVDAFLKFGSDEDLAFNKLSMGTNNDEIRWN